MSCIVFKNTFIRNHILDLDIYSTSKFMSSENINHYTVIAIRINDSL
jgi:hypothetical protein